MKLNIKTKPLRGIQISPQAAGILNPSFIQLIIGPPGSGKTSLIMAMLQDQRFYGGKFDQVIFIGASPPQQSGFDQSNSLASPDTQIIEQFIQMFNKNNSYQDFNLLFIFDDCVAQMNKKQQFWKKLFLNRRHLIKGGTISHIITTQKFSLIPTFIRTCLTQLITFKIPAFQAIAFTKFFLDKQKTDQVIKRITSIGHHKFLYVNLLTSKIYNQQFQQIRKIVCKLKISGALTSQQSTQRSQFSPSQPIQVPQVVQQPKNNPEPQAEIITTQEKPVQVKAFQDLMTQMVIKTREPRSELKNDR